MNVLVVDDSKLARMAAAKALNLLHSDWGRLEAANADEAIAHVKASKVDIALIDFNMPGLDGLSLGRELRRLDDAIAIAIVSANSQREVVQGAKDIGAVFLSKPLTEEALLEFLDGAVAGRKAGGK
jgi:DNA-binding NarL/FixJ family response regulator